MTLVEPRPGTGAAPADVGDEVEDPPTTVAPGSGDGGAAPSPARRRLRLALRVLGVLALVALVAATVALRRDLDRHRATTARAEAAADRVATARADAAVVAASVVAQLEGARADGEWSAEQRAAQVERLATLGLTEDDMEAALEEARSTTAAAEAERDALAATVERQALEDVELQACLVEVRRAVDAAFHAANREGVEVPPTREVCRALAATRGGS
ncbi:hypothetical protein PO878_02670 [Iamia majanohamensis]|uniref:Uncharacterized protein n=1 Tax=Iamia majanohamensis TaxID=467976 RepID=A0AAE9Y6K1_9ACTN|nr:hypothetical protein [Iamia majanohamensis]WCO67624.1 hypothetical protein PO878_02670 [Iamia majanohamensis]